MILIRSIAATALAVACGLCAAQGASAPAPSSAAKKELLQKVLQLQQPAIEGIARQIAEQSVMQLGQQAAALMQTRIPPEQREAVARDVQADFKKYGDEAVPVLRDRALKLAPTTIGALLEERFNEDELKQLIAALDSPVFKRYQQMGGDMQRVLAEKVVADSRTVIEPKLKALQDSLKKRFNIPATPASGPAPKPAASTPKK